MKTIETKSFADKPNIVLEYLIKKYIVIDVTNDPNNEIVQYELCSFNGKTQYSAIEKICCNEPHLTVYEIM